MHSRWNIPRSTWNGNICSWNGSLQGYASDNKFEIRGFELTGTPENPGKGDDVIISSLKFIEGVGGELTQWEALAEEFIQKRKDEWIQKKEKQFKKSMTKEQVKASAEKIFTSWSEIKRWRDMAAEERVKGLEEWVEEEIEEWEKQHNTKLDDDTRSAFLNFGEPEVCVCVPCVWWCRGMLLVPCGMTLHSQGILFQNVSATSPAKESSSSSIKKMIPASGKSSKEGTKVSQSKPASRKRRVPVKEEESEEEEERGGKSEESESERHYSKKSKSLAADRDWQARLDKCKAKLKAARAEVEVLKQEKMKLVLEKGLLEGELKGAHASIQLYERVCNLPPKSNSL